MFEESSLDRDLLDEAKRLGRHKTEEEAVSAALKEYVQHRKQMEILEMFGTIDYDPEYDYKAERGRNQA